MPSTSPSFPGPDKVRTGTGMGALDGIKVLEAGLLVQGPQAAAMLSDWGADVVKIELPGFGDQSRWIPAAPGDGRAPFFIACNRGKRSITIDLRRPEGRDVFLRLVEQADVFISNFKSGTLDEWGLSYDEVAARNPRIIYAAATSFGTVGADAGKEGADLSGQAAGGLISTTGSSGEPVTPVAVTITDHIGCLNLVGGITAALFARERTGRGQRIDVSLLGGQIWAQASELTATLLTGHSSGRSDRGHPLIPGIYGVFPTSDGWLAMVGVAGLDRSRFYDVIGRPELVDRFPQPMYFGDRARSAARTRSRPRRGRGRPRRLGERVSGAHGRRRPGGGVSGSVQWHTGAYGGSRTRTRSTHRGSASRSRLHLGRHRRLAHCRRDLTGVIGPPFSKWGSCRDALVAVPAASMVGGIDEIQHNIIDEWVLGSAKEPSVDDRSFRQVRADSTRT